MSDIDQLKKQINLLEKRISSLEKGASDSPFFEHKTTKKVKSEPSAFSQFLDWLKTDWLMKLGAFLLLLGLGWFVTYSFINNWIGPVGRISLGMLAGAGIMAGGHLAYEKRPNPGKVLIALGGVGLILTMFAARNVYEFFTPTLGFVFMGLVVVAMALLAILHDAKSIAITALLGGALVPLLVNASISESVALSYMLMLNVGTILIATMKGWRSTILLALIITGFYSTSFHGLDDDRLVWLFMALYSCLFFASSLAAILKTKALQKTDLFIAGLNGILLLIWVSNFVPESYISLVLVGVVIILMGVSHQLLRTGKTPAVLLHAALATLFLGAATAFELDGAAMVIAFSVEALLLVALTQTVLGQPKAAKFTSLLQVIPIIMTLDYIDSFDVNALSLFNEDFFVILISILSLGGTAYLLVKNNKSKDINYFAVFQATIASLFAIALIWLSSDQIFESSNLAKGVALVIYTLAGVGAWLYGSQIHRRPYKIAGNILLFGVVLRLLMVEVWSMSLVGRIVTFVAIGALLISTAFLEKRKN